MTPRLLTREKDSRLLSPRRERELARRARCGDERAREELSVAFRPLVFKIANRYSANGHREDVEAIGMAALDEAVGRFDERRGFRLYTFAWKRINGAIKDALAAEYEQRSNTTRWDAAGEDGTSLEGMVAEDPFEHETGLTPAEARRRDDAIEALGFATCEECGRPFRPKRSHARFCGSSCRVSHYRAMLVQFAAAPQLFCTCVPHNRRVSASGWRMVFEYDHQGVARCPACAKRLCRRDGPPADDRPKDPVHGDLAQHMKTDGRGQAYRRKRRRNLGAGPV